MRTVADDELKNCEGMRRQDGGVMWVLLSVFLFGQIVLAGGLLGMSDNVWARSGSASEEEGIWGKIDVYTDSYISVSGKRYDYAKGVIIDTYSLQPNKRGNVRIILDQDGRAIEIYFYGIDMPDVFRIYKR